MFQNYDSPASLPTDAGMKEINILVEVFNSITIVMFCLLALVVVMYYLAKNKKHLLYLATTILVICTIIISFCAISVANSSVGEFCSALHRIAILIITVVNFSITFRDYYYLYAPQTNEDSSKKDMLEELGRITFYARANNHELDKINRNTRLINEKAIKINKTLEAQIEAIYKQAESSEKIAKELIGLKEYETLEDFQDDEYLNDLQ